jgi:aminomethyltransferase
MKQTSLYENHIKLGAKMTPFAGYDMPLYYDDLSSEHKAVRHTCGIFDVSHMGEISITGKDALVFANQLVTNNILPIKQKVTYALLLNDQGQVLDDLLVYLINENHVLLVVNASNTEKDYHWIVSQKKSYDISIKNESQDYAQVAIQGPLAQSIVTQIFTKDFNHLKFMRFEKLIYQNQDVIISRTGYTGEDGFEIYTNPQLIKDIWQKAIDLNAKPCGLGARDTLRFQANLPLYGHEINDDIHPFISGLKFAIKTEKEFNGKTALLKDMSYLNKKIVGIELLEKNIPRQGYKLFDHELEVGYVTTGYLLPEIETPLALAMVDINQASIGNELEIEIRRKRVKVKVRNRKFLNKNYVK